MGALADVYESQRKHAQAEPLSVRVLEERRRVLGKEHPDTLQSMRSVAEIYRDEGKYAQAEPFYEKLVEIAHRKARQSPETAESLAALANLRLREHKFADAEPQLREALTILEKVAPDFRAWGFYSVQSALGASLAGQKKYAAAEPLLFPVSKGCSSGEPPYLRIAASGWRKRGKRIIQLYTECRKPRKASEWRRKLVIRQ
jgi:eukaryotic-like serine/threonine-protein kinase